MQIEIEIRQTRWIRQIRQIRQVRGIRHIRGVQRRVRRVCRVRQGHRIRRIRVRIRRIRIFKIASNCKWLLDMLEHLTLQFVGFTTKENIGSQKLKKILLTPMEEITPSIYLLSKRAKKIVKLLVIFHASFHAH